MGHLVSKYTNLRCGRILASRITEKLIINPSIFFRKNLRMWHDGFLPKIVQIGIWEGGKHDFSPSRLKSCQVE